MKPIIIEIPGEPKPQARTKARAFFNKKAGRYQAQTYDPKGPSADYRARITHEAAIVMGSDPLIEDPIHLSVAFFIPKPKTVPKKRSYPNVNPDIDNYVKALLDALQGVVFNDDKQVCELFARKVYAEGRSPSTYVAINFLE